MRAFILIVLCVVLWKFLKNPYKRRKAAKKGYHYARSAGAGAANYLFTAYRRNQLRKAKRAALKAEYDRRIDAWAKRMLDK